MEPERIQDSHDVARLFAHFFSNVLGILLAILSIWYINSWNDIDNTVFAAAIAVAAGVPLLLLLLGTSIYLHRKGAGRPALLKVWSPVLACAAILPVYALGRALWTAY